MPRNYTFSPEARRQRQVASMMPKLSKSKGGTVTDPRVLPGESLDAATLRLQIARANNQELVEAKMRRELEQSRALLLTREESKQLTADCLERAGRVFDLLLKRFQPPNKTVASALAEVVAESLANMAAIAKEAAK